MKGSSRPERSSSSDRVNSLERNFTKEMVAQIFGKPGSVGQSGTVDIAPLIRTFELRIALGSQVNFGVITINDFKFSRERVHNR
jgi:hypothetical protein